MTTYNPWVELDQVWGGLERALNSLNDLHDMQHTLASSKDAFDILTARSSIQDAMNEVEKIMDRNTEGNVVE